MDKKQLMNIMNILQGERNLSLKLYDFLERDNYNDRNEMSGS